MVFSKSAQTYCFKWVATLQKTGVRKPLILRVFAEVLRSRERDICGRRADMEYPYPPRRVKYLDTITQLVLVVNGDLKGVIANFGLSELWSGKPGAS